VDSGESQAFGGSTAAGGLPATSRPDVQKVLIANRGEIALRVIRACQGAGHPYGRVYSEAARDSLHTRFADDDVMHRPGALRDSYLNIPRIIAARRSRGPTRFTRATASSRRNAEFADIVRTSNITFVGPSGDQIRQMGDKPRPQAGAEAQGAHGAGFSRAGRGRGGGLEDRGNSASQ